MANPPAGTGHSYTRGNEGVRGGGTQSSGNQTRSPSEGKINARVARYQKQQYLRKNGGVAISAQYAKNTLNRRMRSTVSLICQPTLDALSNSVYQRKIAGGKNKQWMCSMESVWKYKETKYAVQNNEFRLFIEGAEVSHYVQGTLNWTIESTGGMNTCRFLLNNTQDAFILTPENLCAGVDKGGWRLSTGGKTTLGPSRGLWRNFAVDETAKYLMYVTKYNEVMGDFKKTKIDPETGMWLYPLGPYRCIIHKHDCVRLFIRLPNTSGVTKKVSKKYWKYGELWTAAFTGFVKDYSWDDDPVNGTRVVSVTCYDYRGLMNRMRVRIEGLPQQSTSGGTLFPTAKKVAKKGVDKQVPSTNKAVGAWDSWLKPAIECGKFWEDYFNKYWGKKHQWPYLDHTVTKTVVTKGKKKETTTKVPVIFTKNPYTFMNTEPFTMKDRLIEMWNTSFINLMRVKYKCLAEPTRDRETFVVHGSGQDIKCTRKAIQKLEPFYSAFAARCVQTFAYSMLQIVKDYSLTNYKYQFKVDGSPKDLIISFEKLKDQSNTAGRTSANFNEIKSNEFRRLLAEYTTTWEWERDGKLSVEYQPPKIGDEVQDKITIALSKLYDEHFYAVVNATIQYNKSLKLPSFSIGRALLIKKDKDTLEALKLRTNLYITELQNKEAPIIQFRDDDTKMPTALARTNLVAGSLTKETFLSYQVRKNFDKDIHVYMSLSDTSSAGKPSKKEFFKSMVDDANTKAKRMTELINKIPIALNTEYTKLDKMYAYLNASAQDVDPPELWPYTVKSNKWNLPGRALDTSGGTNNRKIKTNTRPRGFPAISAHMRYLNAQAEKEQLETSRLDGLTNRGNERKTKINTIMLNWVKYGNEKKRRIETTKRITDKYADFDVQQAGIFADLVEANKSLAHPLMGKSFEEAVSFLTTAGNSQFLIGAVYDITKYTDGVLKAWNNLAVFGVIQRPLTYHEVSAIGLGTTRNIDSYFCPLNGFVHFLRPSQGTGAASIIQTSAASAAENLTQAPSYETRKSMLDRICQALDYQFYVSPMGDLVFEIPNYNTFPEDFGATFKESYTISKDWISSTISEENSDVPTAYKFTGLSYEKKLEDQTKAQAIRNKKQHVYIWPILARRVGVQQQDITLSIPGVGDPALSEPFKLAKDPVDQLRVYAMFYMQRQLGRMHTLMVKHPYRPYMLPNRPIWLVPRQRIGLPQSVSHSMSAPDGSCTTESQLIYTREMFRDGTFRFVGGG